VTGVVELQSRSCKGRIVGHGQIVAGLHWSFVAIVALAAIFTWVGERRSVLLQRQGRWGALSLEHGMGSCPVVCASVL